LTERELLVLRLIAQGLTNHDIGVELSVSTSTVKAYAAKIYRKLGVSSRSEAVAKAISQNIIPHD
jgi:DNA-binding NarL/FixJ family response regulator